MIPETTENIKGQKCVLALSGGVDSALAAWLLKEAGADLSAAFIRCWDENDEKAGCHDKQDLLAASSVASALSIDLEVLDFVEEYRQFVFEPFLQALKMGLNPNPDVLCNTHVKFGVFHRYAKERQADAVATGHYASTRTLNQQMHLCCAEDSAKDQTYFLHRLSASQVGYTRFPLARWTKAEVREKAHSLGLFNWNRKNSTGICFIGEQSFSDFIGRYIPDHPGVIIDTEGKSLGEHSGLHFYTIGQREGLKIGGEGEGWYVAKKEHSTNCLTVAQGAYHPALFADRAQLTDVHWIANRPPPPRWVYSARLRHRHSPTACTLTASSMEAATLVFAKPQRAVTPGQYAVIYDGNICLGGGVIVGFT